MFTMKVWTNNVILIAIWITVILAAEKKDSSSSTCPALSSTQSEDIVCKLNGQDVSCAESQNNVIATVRCKPFYSLLGNNPIYKCIDGRWDPQLTPCTLECGIKRLNITTLHAGNSVKNEFPWVAAIYKSTEYVCTGTIVGRSYVIAAAHCFTTPKGAVLDKELYTIIAGKHYRSFNAEEPSAQSRKIKSLFVNNDYKGQLQKYRDDIALVELDMQLIPTLQVQPACVDWDNVYEDFDFVDGNSAVVAGWSSTNQSGQSNEELKKLAVPYRSREVCKADLPEDFSNQYFSADKICAGEKDSNANICLGDINGNLYFKSGDNHYYVRGIASLVPREQPGNCSNINHGLYTKVSRYLGWFETVTRRTL